MEIPLNERQREAVEHVFGPALVLAGAGSGKTRVITARAARLVEMGASPWSILCVTFTNKAAHEMKERIASLLGIDVSRMWISTFHATCLRILKTEWPKLGYAAMPVVFDASDQKSLVKAILKEKGIDDSELPHRKVMGLISKYKNDLKGPEHMASDGTQRAGKVVAEIFFQYQERLKENNAVDFDDLMVQVIRLFETRPEVLETYRGYFQFIMVDEFQDTNLVQYRLIYLLGSGHNNIFVVGDDDQSIYRWRGARVGNITDFEKSFKNCKVILLEENYRSTGNILKAAHGVVAAIEGRKEKTLWTKAPPGEPVTMTTTADELDEADFVAREIKKSVEEGRRRYGDVAVFYRTNAQSRVIEEAFNQKGIPYRVYGGLKFYDRKEVKDLMAWLRLAMNGTDEISFQRAIAFPPRGVGTTSIQKLKDFARSQNVSPLAACSMDNGVSTAAKKRLAEFGKLIGEIKDAAGGMTASALIKFTLEKSGYIEALHEKKTAQDDGRAENLQELANAPYANEPITEFLERTALQAEADLVDEKSDAVCIMTLHVSKGLEFPVVFMAGLEDGLLPHANSLKDDDQMDEERRLCYVGMTRAMRKLYITHAMSRRTFGKRDISKPSVFLRDIPEDVVEQKLSYHANRVPAGGGAGGGYGGGFGGGYSGKYSGGGKRW